MYLRVMTLDGRRASVARGEVGVFAELKSYAFVPAATTVEEFIQELAESVQVFYGKEVHVTGDTLAERAKSAYRQFVDLGLLVEITKEEALAHYGLTQAEANAQDIRGLRTGDR